MSKPTKYHLVFDERELELVSMALAMMAKDDEKEGHIKDAAEVKALAARIENESTAQFLEDLDEEEANR